ncbi:TPA: 4-oxalomesaconate tautomerase [Citrobacter koseri]|uniref:4-oxalomesaconate tautomerase n=1 Tax=Citrobacter koseri TaxID=545 RepID=UPI001907AC8C|nr:4-oxalomesaconate tautomerase [Citrobacter koseri]MBJ8941554.1 4-oxalomesaconate tautomerase [Citrobacter koseri]HEI8857798.1 4-oxalomesaconate tautomerase [Citrobacter koseri]HEM7910371.1 4-oxalomesaconate tautomerase [Citrobacter koseri]HEM8632214.1 4-oxalomesaconate tautomerase [Citrobacter koseri]
MKKIPCTLMRGGTSRGAFLLAEHLPEERQRRDAILMAIMGSGNELEIDGIGGGNPLTSKVAIIRRSDDSKADIDYLFAQVLVHEHRVDTTPNCGNMLSAVGAFAIEHGLIETTPPVTRVRIRNVNTNTYIEADVQTPDGAVEYEGQAKIDGVPGTAAPVALTFLNAAGAKTGQIFPTGHRVDHFDSVAVTCIDMAMPVVIIAAEDVGKTGYESPAELDADTELLRRIESIRLQAGKAMGLGDVSNMVIPKPMLISPAKRGGTINVRYFMPHSCHKALAITGAIALASSCATEGTVAHRMTQLTDYGDINIEHPGGCLDIHLTNEGNEPSSIRASVIRTARKIFAGEVYIPE